MVFLVRIFNISVPTESVPWCAPISKLGFLSLLIRFLLIFFSTFDLQGTYALPEILTLFILTGFLSIYRVLFSPNYLRHVDIFIKTRDFGISFVFFIGIICAALGDQSNYDALYFIIFLPIITLGWMIYEQHRKQDMLLRVKQKKVKMEIEYEYALYLMMTLVRDCMEENVESQKIFGQLMDLMLTHIEECDD